MTMQPESDIRPGHDNDSDRAVSMRVQAERPRVTRLSRKMLAGGAAIGLVTVSAAVLWALQNNRSRSGEPAELYTTDRHNVADGLTSLPRDYAGVPRQALPLGPALPGDLGRPILNAQNAPSATIPAISSEEQRVNQEIEAARLSRLFASTNIRELSPPTVHPTSFDTSPAVPNQTAQPAGDEAFAQNGQERKLGFVNGPIDRRTTSPDRVAAPASSYVVQAGNVIPASLITGIRSDLPGQITAQGTEGVWDSPTGRFLLIPQGARLIGIYDNHITFGQSRVLLVWTRLIMPNGRSIMLER